MPAPIVLSTLTPETKKVVNPPLGAPVIATKADLRDGTRNEAPSGPPTFTLSSTTSSITASIVDSKNASTYEIRVDSGAAVSGLTVSGLTENQEYAVQVRGSNSDGTSEWGNPVNRVASAPTGPDPIDGYPTTWETPPDWNSLLTVTGTGTSDPAFDPATDIDSLFTYLGAFRIPYFKGGTNQRVGTRGMRAMTLKPADGTNGPNGSLFIGRGDGNEGWVAELQIPDLSTDTNHFNLNPTTVLQNWTEVFLAAPTGNPNGNNAVGWVRYEGGKLYVSGYTGYDGDASNNSNVVIIDDPANLATSSIQGFLNHGTADSAGRYTFEIPAEHQADFGGTLMSGVCANMSIITRASFGHSMLAWDPSTIQATDTDIATTAWTYYPASNKINNFSTANNAVAQYYENILAPEIGFNDYMALEIGDPINGRTRTTFAGLPLPNQDIREHAVTHSTGTGCAFFVPGTDTIMFIGSNNGGRFGAGYKNYTIELGTAGPLAGGYAPFSVDDLDNGVWLFNINDIKNRVNTYDPDFYYYRPKNDLGPFCPGKHKIQTGFYDASTGRLYLLSEGHAEGKYTSQHVVSVFQVGSAI